MPSHSPFARRRRLVVAATVPAVPMAHPDRAAALQAGSLVQELEMAATAPAVVARRVGAAPPAVKNDVAVRPAEATAPQVRLPVVAVPPAAATRQPEVRPAVAMHPAAVLPANAPVAFVAHAAPAAVTAQREARAQRVPPDQRAVLTAHTVWPLHSPPRRLPPTPDMPIWC